MSVWEGRAYAITFIVFNVGACARRKVHESDITPDNIPMQIKGVAFIEKHPPSIKK